MADLSKATPRPWFLHDFTGVFGDAATPGDVTISCDDPATITIAAMGRALTGTIEEAQANAALIFEAVKAYDRGRATIAALTDALRQAKEEFRLIRMKDSTTVYNPTLRIAIDAALKLAEGVEG